MKVDDRRSCEDCKKREWQVSILSPLGRIYLCASCASYALDNRDSATPARWRTFDRLVSKVFKGAS